MNKRTTNEPKRVPVTWGGKKGYFVEEEAVTKEPSASQEWPQVGDKYWKITGSGSLSLFDWRGSEYDKYNLRTGNAWKSDEKPTQEEVDMWNLKQESLNYIDYEFLARLYSTKSIESIDYQFDVFIGQKYRPAWEYEYTNVKPK